MTAEHRRPLVAFLLVAVVCALVVGQSMRDAAQRLVGGGLSLGALVQIAPDMLVTIHASGANGLGGDVPYIGRAVLAVSETAPQTAAVFRSSRRRPLQRCPRQPRCGPSPDLSPARPHEPPLGRTTHSPDDPVHATRTTAVARPAQSPRKVAPSHGKHVAAVRAPSVRAERTAVVQQGKRSVHAAAKALHRHVVQSRHAPRTSPGTSRSRTIRSLTRSSHPKPHPKPHHAKTH